MKCMIFATRNFKELIRDPLSWIFCLGFPIVMLLIMSILNSSIPAESGMKLFEIQNLAPAINVFGLTFIMLFASLLLSNDRKESFLLRIFTSPMKPIDYMSGYMIPLIVLSIGQGIITSISAIIISIIQNSNLDYINIIFSFIPSISSILLFTSLGLLIGTLFNKNAAPGICSIFITFSGILGGIWMDIDMIGGVLKSICNALPFYYAVKSARLAYSGDYFESLLQSGIVLIWAVVITILAVIAFKKKMKQ